MKTILIVDDETVLINMLARLFDDEGYRVVTAHNGREALTSLVEQRPDVVLADIVMPDLDGIGLCLEMQRGGKGAPPLVFMTAVPQQRIPPDCRHAGYLTKPFDLDAVVATVAHAVAAHERASGC
jgi:CheY-like chemotaxis protein